LANQVKQIGDGALGPSASAAVKQVAAKNGIAAMVWPNHNGQLVQPTVADRKAGEPPSQQVKVDAPAADYSAAFQNCPVALGIATLGGSFMDCNEQFCHIIQSSKENILKQTIFSLIAKQDLHDAFDKISQWINNHDRASINGSNAATLKPIVLVSNLVSPCKNADYHDYMNETTTNQRDLIRVCLTPIRDQHCQSTSPMKVTSSHPTLRYLCVTILQDHPTDVAGPLLKSPPTMATVPFELPHSNYNNHSNKIHTTFQQTEKDDRGEALSQFFAIG
jgi:PAS domain-containing protein